jgi:hypothetical protein
LSNNWITQKNEEQESNRQKGKLFQIRAVLNLIGGPAFQGYNNVTYLLDILKRLQSKR